MLSQTGLPLVDFEPPLPTLERDSPIICSTTRRMYRTTINTKLRKKKTMVCYDVDLSFFCI